MSISSIHNHSNDGKNISNVAGRGAWSCLMRWFLRADLLLWVGNERCTMLIGGRVQVEFDFNELSEQIVLLKRAGYQCAQIDIVLDVSADNGHGFSRTQALSALAKENFSTPANDTTTSATDDAWSEQDNSNRKSHWLRIHLSSFATDLNRCLRRTSARATAIAHPATQNALWWQSWRTARPSVRTTATRGINELLNKIVAVMTQENVEVHRVYSASHALASSIRLQHPNAVLVVSFPCQNPASFVRVGIYREQHLLCSRTLLINTVVETNQADSADPLGMPPDGAITTLEATIVHCIQQLRQYLDKQRITLDGMVCIPGDTRLIDWAQIATQTSLQILRLDAALTVYRANSIAVAPEGDHTSPIEEAPIAVRLQTRIVDWLMQNPWHRGHYWSRRIVRAQRRYLYVAIMSGLSALLASAAIMCSGHTIVEMAQTPITERAIAVTPTRPDTTELWPRGDSKHENNLMKALWLESVFERVSRPDDLLLAASQWLENNQHYRLHRIDWQSHWSLPKEENQQLLADQARLQLVLVHLNARSQTPDTNPTGLPISKDNQGVGVERPHSIADVFDASAAPVRAATNSSSATIDGSARVAGDSDGIPEPGNDANAPATDVTPAADVFDASAAPVRAATNSSSATIDGSARVAGDSDGIPEPGNDANAPATDVTPASPILRWSASGIAYTLRPFRPPGANRQVLDSASETAIARVYLLEMHH